MFLKITFTSRTEHIVNHRLHVLECGACVGVIGEQCFHQGVAGVVVVACVLPSILLMRTWHEDNTP